MAYLLSLILSNFEKDSISSTFRTIPFMEVPGIKYFFSQFGVMMWQNSVLLLLSRMKMGVLASIVMDILPLIPSENGMSWLI